MKKMTEHPKMKKFNTNMQHPACLNGLSAIQQALKDAGLDAVVCIMVENGPIFSLELSQPTVKSNV